MRATYHPIEKLSPALRLLLALFWLAIPIGHAAAQSAEETVKWINEKIKGKGFTHIANRIQSYTDDSFEVSLSEYGVLDVSYTETWMSINIDATPSARITWKVEKFGKLPKKSIKAAEFKDDLGYLHNGVSISKAEGDSLIIPCESADIAGRIAKALQHLSELAAEKKEPF
jgi:hypothetical protein